MVNDGCRDGRGEYVEGFGAEDEGFGVIDQTNEGLGGVRKGGMEEGKGRYIGFID